MYIYSVTAVYLLLVGMCIAAPQIQKEEENVIELFSGVILKKDTNGSELLNVKFQPGELKEAARTFEEARGKIKKYAPLVAGLGVKTIAVIGIIFGGITLLVTKAIFVAKLAFLAAAALGIQKFLSGGGSIAGISGKLGDPGGNWSSNNLRRSGTIIESVAAGANSVVATIISGSFIILPIREVINTGAR